MGLSKRIVNIRRSRESLEQKVAAQRQQEIELLAREAAAKDPDYKAAQKEVEKLRDQLHMVRLTRSRKNFSIRKREEYIAAVRKQIEGLNTSEQELMTRLQRVEASIQSITDRAKTRATKELERLAT